METYPKEWEGHLTMAKGRAVFVLPIRPDDERLYGTFFAAETPEDLRRRFLSPLKDFSNTPLPHCKSVAVRRSGQVLEVQKTAAYGP
jgi:acetyltransferase